MKDWLGASVSILLAIALTTSASLAMTFMSVFGYPPDDFLTFAPGLSFRMTAILLYGTGFGVLLWRRRSSAAWAFGLWWGLGELSYNFTRLLFYPSLVEKSAETGLWMFYLVFVLAFFVFSVVRLRAKGELVLSFSGLVATSIVCLWSATIGYPFLLQTVQPLSSVLSREVPGQLTGLTAALLLSSHTGGVATAQS